MVKKFLFRILSGFFLGISVFAPGFSGSIVAIIMGIYQDLLRIASNPFKEWKKNVRYCFPLAIGAAASAVLFVIAFNYLFDTYEKATYLLFVGLITGNLPIIFSQVKKCGFKKHYLIGGVGAFAAALALGLVALGDENVFGADGAVESWLTWGLGGLAGGAVAPVPGMSVSIVLIIIGIYSQLIVAAESLLRLDFALLLPFGVFCVCAVVGVMSASRGIKFVFDKYPGFSNVLVFGFMSGSLLGLLVQSVRMEEAGFNWLMGGVMLAVGLALSMLFVVLGKRMNKEA